MITLPFTVFCQNCDKQYSTNCIVKVGSQGKLSLVYPEELGGEGMIYNCDIRDVECIAVLSCTARRDKLWQKK